MLCQKCGKQKATTHIRSVVNGVVYEKHLCGCCASSEDYKDINGNNLSNILSSMLDQTTGTVLNKQPIQCSCCGSTFSDITQSGRCGCPECYNTFYEQLLPYFKRVHGSVKHIGKQPNQVSLKKNQNKDTVEQLRNMLNQLIQEEKYEEAAIIRDKIKKLEGETL